MNNQELRRILISELGIGGIPEEAQDEIVQRLGDVILKALTVAVFDKIPNEARGEFERIAAKNDHAQIQEFLEEHVPDLHSLMEAEVRKTLQKFAENEGKEEEKAKGRGE